MINAIYNHGDCYIAIVDGIPHFLHSAGMSVVPAEFWASKANEFSIVICWYARHASRPR